MSSNGDVAEGIVARRRNARFAWLVTVALGGVTVASASAGDVLWAGLGLASLAVALVPVVTYRRLVATLPWEVLAFVAAPLAAQSLGVLPRTVGAYLVVPALALALAVELDAFTPVEMSPTFAVLFVVTTTMATAGAWVLVQWVADLAFGTRNLRGLTRTMWSLTVATGVGVVAGVAFAAYFRRVDRRRLGFWTTVERERAAAARRTRETGDSDATADRFRLSERRERQVVRALQAVVVGAFLVGIVERNPGVLVNAGVALAVMELPAVLERDYGLPIDARLTLWIVVPVFLHAVGTLGLYGAIGLWDNLTHALSSSLVAAAGYATVRAFDVHDDEVSLPRTFVAAYLLAFTLAFGVLWELLEFGLDGLASWTGTQSVLAQYSLANTMTDLAFDLVGAVLVAVWGWAYLGGVSRSLADRLGADRETD